MAKIVDFVDGAQSSTTPTIGNISASDLVQYADDAAYEAGESGAPAEGNIYYSTNLDKIRYYANGAWHSLVDEDQAATLENKTLDGTDATGNNTITTDADDVSYDNSSSGLTATDTQAAVDEVEARVDTNETDINDLETLSGSPGATDHGTFTGSTIPDNSDTKESLQALETEVETKIDTAEKGAANGVAELDGTGRIPTDQLPVTAMEFQGSFDASGGGSGSPSLTDGSGDLGDFYRVSAAGTVDHGAGNVTYAIGDSVIYNGSVWEKYAETALADTDSLPEGVTNLYYTEARVNANANVTANTAKVSADGSIDTHSDVDTTTDTPLVGEALTWDGSNWVPGEGGGGSGSGFKNYYDEYGDFEIVDDVSEPTLFNDPGGYTDGDGGTVAGLSVSHETGADKLSGDGSLQIDKAATDSSEDGVTFLTRTIDRSDLGKQLFGSFEWDGTDANYTSGDFEIKAYDVTNAAEIPVVADDTTLPDSKGKIRFKVLPNSTTASVRVSLYLESDSATGSAFTVYLDDLKLGPDSGISIIGGTDQYARIYNDSAQGVVSGVPEELEYDTLDYSNNMDVDLSSNSITVKSDGIYYINISTGANNAGLNAQFFLRIYINGINSAISQQSASTASLDPYGQVSATLELQAGDIITGDISPGFTGTLINGTSRSWMEVHRVDSGSALLSTTETLFQSAAAKIYLSASQTGIGTTKTQVLFDTVDFDRTDLFSATDNGFKINSPGVYEIKYQLSSTSFNGDDRFFQYIDVNGSQACLKLENTGSASNGGAYVSTILKLQKDDIVDFHTNSTTDASFDVILGADRSFASIQAVPDFSAFGVYANYEVVESSAQPFVAWPFTGGQYGDHTSITLTPGTWKLSGHSVFRSSGAPGGSRVCRLGISTTSGNSSTGLLYADNFAESIFGNVSGFRLSLTIPTYIVTITETTTFYLKGYIDVTTNMFEDGYKITAERLR